MTVKGPAFCLGASPPSPPCSAAPEARPLLGGPSPPLPQPASPPGLQAFPRCPVSPLCPAAVALPGRPGVQGPPGQRPEAAGARTVGLFPLTQAPREVHTAVALSWLLPRPQRVWRGGLQLLPTPGRRQPNTPRHPRTQARLRMAARGQLPGRVSSEPVPRLSPLQTWPCGPEHLSLSLVPVPSGLSLPASSSREPSGRQLGGAAPVHGSRCSPAASPPRASASPPSGQPRTGASGAVGWWRLGRRGTSTLSRLHLRKPVPQAWCVCRGLGPSAARYGSGDLGKGWVPGSVLSRGLIHHGVQ